MTAEVLSQLKALRGGLADNVQGDPRYLTLNALDKSVAEIGALASAAPGEAGAVPTQVLGQIKTIRDGIADGLRNDHRYLTLTTLDKSIAEIGGMLAAAGVIAPEHAAPPAPVHFEPGAPAAAPAAAAPAVTPVAKAATPAEAPKPSKLKPILETAAVIAAGVAAAEMIGGTSKPAVAATSKPKPETPEHAEPETDEEAGDDEAENHEAKSDEGHDAETPDDDEAAGDEADEADEAEDHDDEDSEGHATSEKGDDEEDAETSDADEAEGDSDDGEDHAKAEKADDADADKSDDDETAGDEADADEAKAHDEDHDEESEKGDENEASASGAAGKHASKKPDASGDAGDDEMPDAADVIPRGKASGYVPMAAKAGAAQYQPGVSVKFGKLPNKVDLRSLMTPIEDQGDTSSCVANAVAGAYEYWIKKASKTDQNISRLFVYYNARWRDGSQDKDDGSVIQLAMEGLQKFGACPENVWPFDPRLITKKPGGEAYKDAAPYRVQDMAQVPLKLDSWKQALAEGKPIVFGCALFDSFDECSKRGGVVPMPSPDDVARAKHSGHSMCAVGYSDTEKVFIVRNSWGADWGDKGYCYMPYDYLLNEKFNDGDCWVFVPKVPMQPPREVWSNTTEPVTNSGQGVDFPITTYTITDYAHIAVDLFEHVRKPFNGTVLADYGQYVSWASSSLWSEFESFDFTTFLASTAALTGVSSLALESLTETSESSEESESSESESLESSEESEESDESDEESDDDSSDEDDSEDDDSEDKDESDDDDSDSDESDDSDEESDAEGDEDGDGDEDSDSDDSDGDGDESDDDGDDESDGDGDSDGDGESEDDDDDSDEDDSDEDDGGDDDGGDDEGGDEGGGDEGGDDDE